MQIIKKEEVPAVLPTKGGRDTKLRVMLIQLQVGDALDVPTEEWHRKNPPYKIIAGVKKTHGFRFEYGKKADDSGWIFRRIA
jgi:hypothetical protein